MALYENFVLENKMTDLVNTNVDVNALFTVDNSLEGEAGLKKIIHVYEHCRRITAISSNFGLNKSLLIHIAYTAQLICILIMFLNKD